MAEGTKLEIVSPERLVLSETGGVGHRAGRRRLLHRAGRACAADDDAEAGLHHHGGCRRQERPVYYVRGGFADVSPAGVTILAEQAVPTSEFDRAAIEASLLQAEKDLAAASTPEARTFLEELVYGLRNLLVEAQHLNQAHIH